MSSERYQIKAKIGQGGIGAVYRAFDTHLQREVAVKRLLPPEESESFEDDPTKTLFKEAHLLSALQHPNVVSVYDVGTDEDGVFVVMELVDGETFDQVVERGLLTEEDFAEMVAQTLEALIAAQDKDLVHRDIKPTNLMVKWLPSGKFQFKLLDFGLAKFSPKPTRQTIGLNDAILGSIHFMAPEQFERKPLDCRTDLYAMGCMFYYGLSGRYPFDGDTAAEVMAAHLQHRVAPLQEVRQDVFARASDWVMWLMSREMNDRPNSAQEALECFFTPEMVIPGSGGGGSVSKLIVPEGGGATLAPTGSGPVGVKARTGSGPVRIGSGPVRAGSAAVRLGSGPVRPVSAPVRVGSSAVRRAGGVVPTGQVAASPVPVPGAQSTTGVVVESALPHALPSMGKPSMSPVKKWTIISLVSVGLIIIFSVYQVFFAGGELRDRSAVIEYLNDDAAEASAEWVEKLVPYLNPPEDIEDRDDFIGSVMDRLKSMEGEGVEDALLEAMDNSKGKVQERLCSVVSQRNMKTAVGPLTRIALGTDTKNAEKAIAALSVLGETRDGGTIMEAMINSSDSGLRRMGEDVLGVLIEKAMSKEDIVPALERGLEPGVQDPVQQAALRLLGRTGTSTAARVVARVLESGDEDLQMAAIIALREWPDDSQIDRLSNMAGSAATSMMRRASYEAFLRALAYNQDRPRDVVQHKDWWERGFKLAETKERKMLYLQFLANVPESFALDIVKKMQVDSDSQVRSYATQAKSQIERGIRQKKNT